MPQPYNRMKRYFIELSRTQLFLSIAGALFILTWVFILGIIVGRGIVSDTITQAFKDQIAKLQAEKKELMDKYLIQEQPGEPGQQDTLKPQLDFYDKLSKKDGGEAVITPLPPAAPPMPAQTTPEPAAQKPAQTAVPEKAKMEKKEPPAEAKAKREPKPAPAETGAFLLQIGAYREEASAQSSLGRMKEKGYPAQLRLKESPQKGGIRYRVQLGPYKTRAEAEKVLSKLAQDGFQALVISKKD
jgi:cell division protein FtsN